MKQILFLFLNSLALTGIPLFALPLDSLMDETVRAELLRGNTLNKIQFDSIYPVLMPDYEPIHMLFDKISVGIKPSLLAETIYLYKKPARYSNENENAGWRNSEKTDILNALVSISSLAGIQYYSASRKSMHVFYAESSVIGDPLKKDPQADPVFTDEIPSNFTLYARQKDLTFGDNVYRYDYSVHDGAIIFTQTNYTTLSYRIIPAVAKGNLCVIAAVIDAGEYFLIYAASLAKVPSIPFFNKRAGTSFASRAEALIKWFTWSIDH
jgi:hypothetical protein